MTTTPKEKKGQSSSPDRTMTDFKDGLGRPIPADAFENDVAPGEPKLSEGDRKAFDDETAALKAQAEKLRSHSGS
jgi:hypothetical protein